MQITLIGHQIDLGDSWREYADKAISEAVQKYFTKATDATVRVSHEGEAFRTEITTRPVGGLTISATGKANDAYGALDEAIRKMNVQLKKYKNKMTNHKAVPTQMVAVSVIDAPAEAEEPMGDAPVIIAEMQAEMPTCTVSEAVMHMDLAGLPAYLFRNSAHGELSMVYRRNDGNIGWVDPKNKQ